MASAPSERPTPPRRRRWLGWAACGAAAFLVAAGITAYAGYQHLYGNIRTQAVRNLGKRPPKIGSAVNILVIGSDSRAGENDAYGREPGARSDTILVMHIAAGGKRAVGVSLPRDSIVRIPDCEVGGRTIPAHLGMINASFNDGGAACTWKTIEATTGIHLDHFVQIDFAGFQRMVDALGGIEVDLPKAVHDTDAHLDLASGHHLLNGTQALAYVRARHAFGDGSDLGRIERQQRFMSAMITKATSTGLLTDPPRMFRFLDAATNSVTTDNGLGLGEMRRLASGLSGVSSGAVKFVTVPNHPWPVDPNRVQWAQPAARHLFHAINTDSPTIPLPKGTPPT
ncbi:MAG TPA: LCP family protein [Streptosporangiaceae bacterium]|jgi:LCP family protein required for cell wall assembly